MFVLIFVSILAILFTFLEVKGQIKNGMKLGFVLLTIIASLQYYVGSDYVSYYNNYLEVASSNFSFSDVLQGYVYKEPGWGLFIWIFSHIPYGFFLFIAVLAIVENIIYYKFIRNYADKRWWVFSVFLYTICTSTYLMNFAMLRQALVDAIFLACWPLILKRKYLIVLVILFLCTFIHNSAKIILPFAFWGMLSFKRTKLWGIGYALLLVVLYLYGGLVNDIVTPLLNMDDFQMYAETYGADDRKVGYGGLGFWIYMTPVAVSIYYFIVNKNDCVKNKSLVAISAIGALILPFGVVMPMIGRVANFFVAFRLVAYPIMYQSVENTTVRRGLLFLIIFITIVDYFYFFNDPIWKSFTTYRTIFEAF